MSWTEMTPKDRKDIRQFGTGVALILAVAIGVRALRHHDPHVVTLGAIALAVAALAWALPVVLLPVFRVWMLFAAGLLWLNTRILLGIVFFIMMSPVAFVSRLFGSDPLEKRFDRKAVTYWTRRAPLPKDPARFRRQY